MISSTMLRGIFPVLLGALTTSIIIMLLLMSKVSTLTKQVKTPNCEDYNYQVKSFDFNKKSKVLKVQCK